MSRSIRPNVMGTHRNLSVGIEVKERGYRQTALWGTPTRVVAGFRKTGAAEIAEGLAQIAAPLDLNEYGGYGADLIEVEDPDLFDHLMHEASMREWSAEIMTINAHEGIVDETGNLVHDDDRDDPDALDPRDGEPTDWWPFLTGSVDEVFPDGGYVIDGPSPSETSPSAHGYVRVWQLAKSLGWTSKETVATLRADGEWVKCATSHVALPVAEAYGYRTTTTPTDPLEALRLRLGINA